MMNYKATHVSRNDHSDAMLVSYNTKDSTVILVNEDGYEWEDPEHDWLPID